MRSPVDRMTDGSPDSDRVGSTGSWGHEGMDEDPVMMYECEYKRGLHQNK